jgi:A/G-specific adenine glycosylase
MPETFADRLLDWFDRHGRRGLPWQDPRTPYRVWLSEVMLQQTQVAAAIPYFLRFVERFPSVAALAGAATDEVLQYWAGLGYYARARNLHRAAQQIVARHAGELPQDLEALTALPGIGRSTAAAILAQAHGLRFAILDANVKRVLARYGAVPGWPGSPAVARPLWALAESLLPQDRLADYTQAMMDLGATLCTARNPACRSCPVSAGCRAHASQSVALYPQPKPRRARPLREAQLLLVEDGNGALLFERRPPAGIWGGLWCLPIAESSEDAAEVLHSRYGLSASPAGTLPPVRHGFTHFDYSLSPRRLHAAPAAEALAEHAALRWINIASEPLPGLPAPIAKLLRQLRQPQ